MCSSGACVDGFCLDAKVDAGGDCDSNGDCLNNACGKETYELSADNVCCESNSRTQDYLVNGYYYFCTGQDAGDLCGDNAMCSNGRCGKENYTMAADYVCCPSGAYDYESLGDSSYYFCKFSLFIVELPSSFL